MCILSIAWIHNSTRNDAEFKLKYKNFHKFGKLRIIKLFTIRNKGRNYRPEEFNALNLIWMDWIYKEIEDNISVKFVHIHQFIVIQ